MRALLNTLFVLSEDSYLSLDGENVVVNRSKEESARFPLHTLEGILTFAYAGVSPALMGACAHRGVDLAFFTPRGRFLARTVGETRGNVLLRQAQYRASDSPYESVRMAKGFILGKIYNARWVLERATRDHPMRVPVEDIKRLSSQLATALASVETCETYGELLGLEGVGIDPYVGFLHRPRPGRSSLALDMMEELRCICADRFVLSCINQRILTAEHCRHQESGAVLLTDEGRRAFLSAWQKRRQETLTHPFLGEKIAWGLVPYVQALLLARTLRGDLERYPPFFWK